jgi:Ca-activated chloride channel family protein
MRVRQGSTKFGTPRALIVALCGAIALLFVTQAGEAQTQNPQVGRPRRAQPAAPQTAAPVKSNPTPEPTPPQMPPPKATPSPSPQGEEIDPSDVIRSDTNLVNLNVRVIDRFNRPVNNVRQEDFRVYENGVPQPIEFFSKEEVPISYGLAIDNSGSLRSQITKVIDAGKTIVESNKPGDETFLMRFIDREKIETVQDFTSNKQDLLDGLDQMYVEGGQTAVIDAVMLAADHVAEYKKGDANDRRRRALIVVTDGEDRASYYKEEQLFKQLREDDVQIYVIGFTSELDDEKKGFFVRKSPKSKAVALIERLASETGGRAFYPKSLSELPQIANDIVRDLRTQYVIGYNPTNKARDGSYRTIRVTVADNGRDKRIALTRAGYTAPLANTATPAKSSSTQPNNGRQNP